MQNAPVTTSIIFGIRFSVLAGMVYMVLLHEPGPVFYPFAALAFLGGPLITGTTAAVQSPKNKYRAFLIAGCAVAGAVLVLFFMSFCDPAALRSHERAAAGVLQRL